MIEEEVLEAGMTVRIDAIKTRIERSEESVKSFVSEFRQLLTVESNPLCRSFVNY